MRQIRLDKEGNIVIDKDFEMIEGGEELGQSIERILTTRLGEWFLGDIGLRYDNIQGKNIDHLTIKYELTEAILQDERIKDIEQILIYSTNDRYIDIDITIIDIDDNYYRFNNLVSNGGVVIE